jgi:sec-independent protein translocase protein TatA
MLGLRVPELLIILLIVVVLFGANKIPQLGKGLGEGIRGFKKALGGDDDEKPVSQSGTTRTGGDAGGKQS